MESDTTWTRQAPGSFRSVARHCYLASVEDGSRSLQSIPCSWFHEAGKASSSTYRASSHCCMGCSRNTTETETCRRGQLLARIRSVVCKQNAMSFVTLPDFSHAMFLLRHACDSLECVHVASISKSRLLGAFEGAFLNRTKVSCLCVSVICELVFHSKQYAMLRFSHEPPQATHRARNYQMYPSALWAQEVLCNIL